MEHRRNQLPRFGWNPLVTLGLLACLFALGRADTVFAQQVTRQDQPPLQEHPLMPAIRIARQSLEQLQQVQDYEAVFIKREWINNQLVTQQMQIKLRERPFSVYLKYVQPYAGREILYVAGRNQNKLLAHLGAGEGVRSLVGTVSLAVNSPDVMAENRHPITDIGMRKLVALVLEQWEFEAKYQESEVQYYPNARLGNVPCEVLENSHPRPRRQFKFQMTRLFIDKQSRLPIRVENYDFPRRAGERPPLVEEYTYTNVKVNVGLSDLDFDQKNARYSF